MLEGVKTLPDETRAARDPAPFLYGVHPFLDPRLPGNNPALARIWLSAIRRALADPCYYAEMLRSYARPL
ncbi:MAG: hypothetical protein ABIH26_11310, partial [Candidatus Eisenbacteria bacterium]